MHPQFTCPEYCRGEVRRAPQIYIIHSVRSINENDYYNWWSSDGAVCYAPHAHCSCVSRVRKRIHDRRQPIDSAEQQTYVRCRYILRFVMVECTASRFHWYVESVDSCRNNIVTSEMDEWHRVSAAVESKLVCIKLVVVCLRHPTNYVHRVKHRSGIPSPCGDAKLSHSPFFAKWVCFPCAAACHT